MTAVIPVFNGRDLLVPLLRSMAAQTVPFAETIVVDNGSTDGVASLAAEMGCRVIAMGHNAGFARAVNTGWQAAATEWVAILNSDVELAPDWVERCLAQSAGAAFVTGKLLQSANTELLDGTYDLISRAGCAWRAGHGQADQTDLLYTQKIGLAPGTACLYRREVLQQLGGFDEGFESYLEDVDLGLRCVQMGYRGVYVPTARATHRGSATFGAWDSRVVRLISRNQVRLLSLHYDRRLLRAWFWPIVAGQLLWGLLAFRHGSGLAWVQGKWEGLRHFEPCTETPEKIRRFIEQTEAEIQERAADPYWLWYFRLTAGAP